MTTSREDFSQLFETLSSYVEARNFSSQREAILKLAEDKDLPSDVGIAICNWFFRKTYSFKKPSISERKSLVKKAARAHNRAKNIISKGTYLNYLDRIATTELAKHFYRKRFGDEKYFVLQLQNDVTLVKELFRDPDFTDERLIRHFCRWLRDTPIPEQQNNLLDVLILNYSNDERVKEIREGMRFDGQTNRSLYADKQSVHDEEITEASLISAQNLMMWYKDHPVDEKSFDGNWGKWVRSHLSKTGKFDTEEGARILDLVVTRCAIDHTTFGNVVIPFTILDFWVAVLKFVFDMPDPSIAYQAIYEECRDMAQMCSSGYIQRGVTALQGLPGAENFNVIISERKRLIAVFSTKMAEAMERAPDEVLLGTYDQKYQDQYLSYIEGKANDVVIPKLAHLKKTLDDHISEAMDQFSSFPGWTYIGGKLIKPTNPIAEEAPE